MSLTARQDLFVLEYLKDLNATQAAIRAGYAENSASVEGCRLLGIAKVQEAIASAIAQRSERVTVTTDMVVKHLWDLATADPNELMEHRRTCCRFCWGRDFKYQRTTNELRRDRDVHEDTCILALTDSKTKDPGEFNEQGGDGFDARKPPNADCPECSGEGIGEVFVKDTRRLTPAVRRLYAGVKRGKDNIEVVTRSQDKALELLGRHLGMFTDKLDVNVRGNIAQRILNARNRAGGFKS